MRPLLQGKKVKVWSSPFLRCIQTAAGAAVGLGQDSVDIEIDELLSEVQMSGYYNDNCRVEDLIINRRDKQEFGSRYLQKYLKHSLEIDLK